MSTPGNSSPAKEQMPSRYEKTHLRGRPFVVGTIGFFAFTALMFVVVWKLLQGWSSAPWPPTQAPTPPSATARWNSQVPQVQINPAIDLAHVRETEDRRLHARRWNDDAHTYATIPIDDAMKLISEASAKGRLSALLPAPQPATPIDLQDQKSREINPPQMPNP